MAPNGFNKRPATLVQPDLDHFVVSSSRTASLFELRSRPTHLSQTVSSNSIHLDVHFLSSSSVQLVWPNTNGTFVLDGHDRLTTSNAWETIGQWPQLGGNEFTVIVPLTNAQRFFRLRQVARRWNTTTSWPARTGSSTPTCSAAARRGRWRCRWPTPHADSSACDSRELIPETLAANIENKTTTGVNHHEVKCAADRASL